MTFRYDVSPKSKVSVLAVKGVPAETDMMALRPTMFGALCAGKLTCLPKTPTAATLWEATFIGSLDSRLRCRSRSTALC